MLGNYKFCKRGEIVEKGSIKKRAIIKLLLLAIYRYYFKFSKIGGLITRTKFHFRTIETSNYIKFRNDCKNTMKTQVSHSSKIMKKR